MIKRRYLISAIIVLILIFVGIVLSNTFNKSKICTSDGKCINLEIADTEAERQQGLMYRTSLNNNSGMLFIFQDEGVHSFWMKNTFIPLDMLWLDESAKVMHIESATPCKEELCRSYSSNESSKYVLEINAGKVDELGIKIGDKLDINI